MRQLFFTIFILIIALALSATAHSSVIVNYEGTAYQVTSMEGSFVDLRTEIENSPWWGNSQASSDFAIEVNDALGVSTIGGPFFAVFEDGDNVAVTFCFTTSPCLDSFDPVNKFEEFTYAKATVVPIPAAIWLFMSGIVGLVMRSQKAR